MVPNERKMVLVFDGITEVLRDNADANNARPADIIASLAHYLGMMAQAASESFGLNGPELLDDVVGRVKAAYDLSSTLPPAPGALDQGRFDWSDGHPSLGERDRDDRAIMRMLENTEEIV